MKFVPFSKEPKKESLSFYSATKSRGIDIALPYAKMEKSIDVLRKVFTMKKAGEKKIKAGHQKSKHISDWHSARKIVNNEIANTAMVKKMVKGSPYYGLVKAKLDELVKAKLGLGQ